MRSLFFPVMAQYDIFLLSVYRLGRIIRSIAAGKSTVID